MKLMATDVNVTKEAGDCQRWAAIQNSDQSSSKNQKTIERKLKNEL
jgi:hypothetical protein